MGGPGEGKRESSGGTDGGGERVQGEGRGWGRESQGAGGEGWRRGRGQGPGEGEGGVEGRGRVVGRVCRERGGVGGERAGGQGRGAGGTDPGRLGGAPIPEPLGGAGLHTPRHCPQAPRRRTTERVREKGIKRRPFLYVDYTSINKQERKARVPVPRSRAAETERGASGASGNIMGSRLRQRVRGFQHPCSPGRGGQVPLHRLGGLRTGSRAQDVAPEL